MLNNVISYRARPTQGPQEVDASRVYCQLTLFTKVYVVHVSPSSYLFKHDGSPYDREAYYAHPDDFHSRFYETVSTIDDVRVISQLINPCAACRLLLIFHF